jgi:DNA-binding MarR family transcriptional regulator
VGLGVKPADLRPIERRLLAYLDQHGPTHRERVVVDLAGPESHIGYRRDQKIGAVRGSNGATPLIMGAWCRRLIAEGLVNQARSDDRFWAYRHHEITAAGRRLIREAS